MKISLRVTRNMFPTLAARLPQGAHDAVAASLIRVQEGCSRRSRVDTGEMRDSWAVVFSGPLDGQVFSDDPKVIFHEYGTVNLSAQPMLAPSIDEERPRFVAALASVVSELG